MSIILCIFLLLLIVYYLQGFGNRWIKKEMTSVLKYFKYRIFLRLWIQSFLNFVVSASVGIYYTQ